MSRSVPGSRSAVLNAAVVWRTNRWQTPEFALWFLSCASTALVMSRTSRFFLLLTLNRCITLSFPGQGCGMPRLIGSDLGLVLEGETDVIEPLQQTVPGELIDRKACIQTVRVVHGTFFEINGDLIIRDFGRFARQFRRLFLAENDRQHSVLNAVIGEDVGEGGSDHCAKAEIGQRPHGMLARGTAAEVLPCHQNARARVTRLVERKRGVGQSLR